MRIGNKIFPYPILNNDKELSGYKENSSFELLLETTENGQLFIRDGEVVLKNIRFELVNDELNDLYIDGKLECALLVECSSTVYRQKFNIGLEGKDIEIPIELLNDQVYISSFLYASSYIDEFASVDFDDDFKGYSFKIEEYDIVTIDDGYKFRIDIDPENDNKISSIFTIVRADSKEHLVTYESGSEKIKIYLPTEHYDEYTTMKFITETQNILFGLLVVPILTRCLDDVKKNFEEIDDVEDIIEQKKWFKAICIAYEKKVGIKFTIDEFNDNDTYSLAQLVLNDATCNGLADFANLLDRGMEDDENEE